MYKFSLFYVDVEEAGVAEYACPRLKKTTQNVGGSPKLTISAPRDPEDDPSKAARSRRRQ